ncbi:hypothetical protein FOA52_002075 [Chlamydomonas sp. UWO 241]|nr:hypothetical protein FOA52_002075 [Chlamydomonas sp. UWO 241]
MPTGQSHIDMSMSALCVLGGAMGYMRKKSLPSLLGGLGIGAAYACVGYYINTVDASVGHQAGAVTSLVLAGMGGVRLVKTKKVMPAGVMTAAGLLALAYHTKKAQEWM